ncbi:uncharacterized protein HQ_3599A [Haloquadratum walsbyi DSM 16790]|jgi:hypothetical protein|uniref:Uncharacterized protein n=2 Tax=Haloquadratum walsbyi TaxID=293091 RepID=Q18EE1_HALWD|nr:uncharacterized protein HQ_3599A [Haloquadratum walsbyi DSM 16790]
MNESILKDMSPYDMITESDVDSLDEALPVDANIRVCTPSVESELDTTNTDELNGSIQTVTQDDSNTLSLVVSADMTDTTATAHITLTPMTARALAIELLSKADGLDAPVVDVLDDEGSNMISGHSCQE